MKNLAYARRRDERAHQHNLLHWMICGSTPSDISDACIGAINSLMCVSFIMRRLQPLVGERRATDQSYTVYFRQDKSELKDLYREIGVRNFLWCIDMIYKSTLPAMNINSISLAPHAADRAAENQDRRKWVSWLKEIEKKAEKDNVIDFDQNTYCTVNEADRELERYPEDFAIGEEPTWWVMGSSKTEPPQKTERQQKSASSSGQRKQTSGGPVPQQGASSGGSYARDAVKIDNEIIDSIFRMNSGGDDDRWTIINPTAGLDTYTSFEGGITLSGATVSVKFNIDANTGYPIIQTVFGPCLADGKNATYWECMLRCLTSSLVHFEEKTSAEKIILSYVRKGNAAWLQLYAFMCAQLDYWTPSGRQSHQRVDTGREEPRQCTWTVDPDHQGAEKGPHWWGNDSRHDDSEEELLGPGLAPEGCQCKREHEDLPDDGQRTGMDKHRGEIVLRFE